MIKFGTSGFRGIIADNFTKDNVKKVAYALTKYFPENFEIPIGFDNRFMGNYFAKWMSEVFVAYGFSVKFYQKSTPSTLIAFETKNKPFGVHITASHNPYFYSGVKIFMEGGRETTSDINDKLQKFANKVNIKKIKTIDFDKAVDCKKINLVDDISTYCNSIIKFVNSSKINRNLKILFNNMNGSSLCCAEYIFSKMKLNYKIFRGQIDPYFENKVPAPYVNNLEDQIKILKKEKFDLGIAVDGDGDRVTFIDKDGTPYDCNYISAIFYYYLLKYKNKKGDVVKNCALTELIQKIADFYHQKTYDAKTGFKNIADIIANNKNILLGIESNGIALSGGILHKDGLLCASIMIEIVSQTQKTIKELLQEIKDIVHYNCCEEEFSYPITDEKKAEINKLVFVDKILPTTPDKIVKTSYVDGLKMWFKDNYWAVIRFSGNENVVRLFVEMKNKKQTETYIKLLEDFIGVSERQI